MKAGIGSASAIVLPNGLVVAALVAVNAVGDIVDPATGAVVAGVRTEDGKRLADARLLIRSAKPSANAAAARREHDDCCRRNQRQTHKGRRRAAWR